MAGKVTTKTFSGGMNKDIDFSLLKDDQYYDAQNYKLVSDEHSNGYVLENAEGNSQWLDVSSINGIDDSYYLVGQCFIQPYLILFYTTNNKDRSPFGGSSKIIRLTIDKDEIQNVDIIYNDGSGKGFLNFSTTYPIKAVGHFETEDNIKVYWVDGYNDIRWMNIMDDYLDTYDYDLFDLTPDFPFDNSASDTIRLSFEKYTQGNIDCSTVQYAYQYFIPNGPATVYSPASAMIQIPLVNSEQSGVIKGGDKDEDSGYGVQLNFNVYNKKFTKVRFVAIEYSTYNGVPTVRIFSERDLPIDSTTDLLITDVGETIGAITYDEYIIQNNTSFTAGELAIKDNYLFAGNIKEEQYDIDIDCRTYRFDGTSSRLYNSNLSDYYTIDGVGAWTATAGLGGGSGSDWSIPATADCINLYNKSVYNSTGDEWANPYVRRSPASSVLGATGKNLSVTIGDTDTDVIDTLLSTSKDSWSASGFIHGGKDGSFARNEVYRIGIVFRNAKMQPSPVKWMCDLKFPGVYDAPTTTDYNIVKIDGSGDVVANKLWVYASYIGTGDYARTAIDAVTFELVAVPRTSADRSVLAQGIIQPTMEQLSSSTYFPIHFMVDETYSSTPVGYTNSEDLVRFISPEVSFNKNLDYQQGDFIHYLGHYTYEAVPGTNRDVATTGIHRDKVWVHEVTGSTFAATHKEELDDTKVIGYVADEDYRTSVGTKEYQPYVRPMTATPDEGGPCTTHACLSITSANLGSWWANIADRVPIANYKRDVFTSQYGGVDYYSRQNNTYIAIGDPSYLQSVGAPNARSYEGDTFIDWFFYHNACLDLDKADTATEAATFLFPIETSISLSHRLDDGILRNTGSVNAILTQEIAGDWESDAIDGNTRSWEQEDALYQYNPIYSQRNNGAFYLADNDNVDNIERFPTRIKRSELKINGELTDSFTIFKPNNFIDLNGQYGPLNSMLIFKNNLYFWQDSGFGVASVNTRSLIQDNQPGGLALGTGGVLDRVDYLSDSIGNKNSFGIAKSRTALYWGDNNKNELFKFDTTLKSVSKLNGIQTWMNEQGQMGNINIVYDHKYNDVIFTITFARLFDVETVSGSFVDDFSIIPSANLSTTVDHNVIINARFPDGTLRGNQGVITYGGTYWSFTEDPPIGVGASVYYAAIDNDFGSTYTVTFNEQVDAFTSFNSFTPARYLEINTNFLSTNGYRDIYIHNSFDANRGTYFETEYDSEFTTVFNKDFQYTKVWDGLKWYTESQNYQNIKYFKDTFDKISIYNDYQHTGDRDLYYKGTSEPSVRPTQIVRRDRTFSMQIPRSIVDQDVSTSIDVQDISNWDGSTGFIFKERIRSKYIVVNTTYDNSNGYIYSVPFISSIYRKSIR